MSSSSDAVMPTGVGPNPTGVFIRRDPLDPETDPEREHGMTEAEMGVMQPKNTKGCLQPSRS